ncbi:MAG: thiamine pyrophosphate-dependent enzyme, partial [bacterium]|nr:thiamine pyrophosphate-dependent enzyme [bacterium]
MSDRLDAFACQNATYVERLLADYQRNADSVPPEWRTYFRQLTNGGGQPPAQIGPSFNARSLFDPPDSRRAEDTHLDAAVLQDRVDQLIRAYRVRGHLAAKIDPLGMARPEQPELDPAYHRLKPGDLERPFSTASISGGPKSQSLRELILRLEHTYCRYIGAQFMHIGEPEARIWLQNRMEECANRIELSRNEQIRILTRLTDAAIFEEFVRKKYVGAKTFSLEGGESLIPLLDLAIDKASRQGVAEIVLGMAHRGRLNVLANILGKQPKEIFWEFEDQSPELHTGRGDVKYHLGFSSDWVSSAGKNVHLSLCFNPSHLEFVNTVAMGRMRAKQDLVGDTERKAGMVVLIHGDAAFAGEGIVQETLNLSQLPGYRVGGTVHIIVNNQIGFTTSSQEARSTMYASDIARMLQIPIFHVNGEHPEAVAQVIDLALDFRAQFQRDVIIDMYCFRRWGHNEGDEPKFTQPLMYDAIDERKSVRRQYLHHLKKLGEVTDAEADEITRKSRQQLEVAFDEIQQQPDFFPDLHTLSGQWYGYRGSDEPADDEPDTTVDAEECAQILTHSTRTPGGFT